MKSKADQRRMTARLATATSRLARTAGCDHDPTRAAINVISKATWMAIQKRLREMPPRAGCTTLDLVTSGAALFAMAEAARLN